MKKFYLALILSLASLLAIPQQALAALAIGVSAQVGSNFSTALSTPAVTTQTTGSTYVIFIAGPLASNYNAPTDNKGNIYSPTPSVSVLYQASNNAGSAFVCQNCAGGAGHVFTANFTGFSSAVVIAVEITSAGAYAILDQSATTPNLPNVTTANSPSITPTVNGEVVLSFAAGSVGTNTTITDASGYNNILQVNANGSTNGNPIGAVGGLVQSTAGATNDVFTIGATANVGTMTLSFTPKTPSGPSPTAFRIFP